MSSTTTKNIKNLKEISNGYFNVPIEGNPEADKVWGELFMQNIGDLDSQAHSLFMKGIKELGITEKQIPKLDHLNEIISKKIEWNLVPTKVEYSTSDSWFEHFNKKSFLVTDFIRSPDNMDYTPYPDTFHDRFGHLPFLCSEEYMDLAYKLGILYKEAKSEKEKNEVANFWWYVFEFGLIKEGEVLKAFGAGLMSSKGERDHAFSKNVKLNPFDLEKVKTLPPSAHEFHKELFVIDSFEQIKEAVDNWK